MTRYLTLALASVFILALLGLGIQRWLMPPPEQNVGAVAAPSASRTPEPAPSARVTALNGDVEQYIASTGRWEPLTEEAHLSEDAVLRTKAGSTHLAIGADIRIVVNPRSQFRLGEVSATLSKIKIEGGRVTASIDGGGERQLMVEVLGNDAVLSSKDGEFSVIRSEDAQVTVATRRGSVELAAEGSAVTVRDGEQATVEPGQKPGPVIKIPGSLFVKLSQNQKRKLRTRVTRVEGETTPGALITINGKPVSTKGGVFDAEVELNEGHNTISVEAEDVLGRQRSESITGVVVDTRPPDIKGKVEW